MNRFHLKGSTGDSLHAVLCSAGFNIRWLLRMIAKKGLGLFYTCCWAVVWGNLLGNFNKFLSPNHSRLVLETERGFESEFFRPRPSLWNRI
ncbi:hypothetical protein B9Z45_00985 [Limnohabitans sp. 2KL-17]|nr:hypothetical protein B9Z45_00985 [Limnohabitans sp. 2KL-17]